MQPRTQKTRKLLLDAALRVFVRDGYEKAQLDAIAQEAGRTKGALYGHFESKEHLFLTLLEECLRTAMHRAQEQVSRASEGRPGRIKGALRQSFIELQDPDWSLLSLELKLYAMRHPESKQRLQEMYRRAQYLPQHASKARTADLEARFWVLNTLGSAIVLDMHFVPQLMTRSRAQTLLGSIFDGLFQNWAPEAHDKSPGPAQRKAGASRLTKKTAGIER